MLTPVKADLSQTQSRFLSYYWELEANGNVAPGAQVTYYFEVADNDGSKRAEKGKRTPGAYAEQCRTALEMDKQLNAGTQSVKDKDGVCYQNCRSD